MPETIRDKSVFSLLEVAQSIQKTLATRYSSVFWVKAEMNKLNHYSHSGHCYPELVEKRDGKVIAQMKSILWKTDYFRINDAFLSILKEPLKDGINILFSAAIIFDPLYGLSLRVVDIDPSYTLGELEREKLDAIERLTREGIFTRNQQLPFPVLPQRVAVISVETSKGYSDYLQIIDHNPWGYKFFNFLFPSLLQGERSIASILYQLDRIRKVQQHFDIVTIIRGGGGDVGLSSFNSYELARAIALFPIPVLTGIGHSTNETVAEMVAHQNAITPTNLADILIQAFHNFAAPVRKAEELIAERAQRMVKDEKLKLRNTVKYFQSVTHNGLLRNHHDIESATTTVVHQSRFRLRQETQALDFALTNLARATTDTFVQQSAEVDDLTAALQRHAQLQLNNQSVTLRHLERQVNLLDPINVLRRGYTITLKNGKAIKNPADVEPGDVVTTTLAEGQITSIIQSTSQPDPTP